MCRIIVLCSVVWMVKILLFKILLSIFIRQNKVKEQFYCTYLDCNQWSWADSHESLRHKPCLLALHCSGSLEPESSCHDRDWIMELPMEADICSGSLEPESSCHDRDWIMELPMEADILTITGILTPEGASVAPCLLRLCRSFCGCPRCGAAPI